MLREVPVVQESKDSVRTEVRYVDQWFRDTVWLPIEAQEARARGKDTVSELRNRYCTSRAEVGADGMLTHVLKAIPQRLPVETKYRVIRRDTTIYRDRYISQDKVVEVEKPLSWYQRLCVRGFPWAVVVAVVLLGLLVWRVMR